jgi:hypothetical protein
MLGCVKQLPDEETEDSFRAVANGGDGVWYRVRFSKQAIVPFDATKWGWVECDTMPGKYCLPKKSATGADPWQRRLRRPFQPSWPLSKVATPDKFGSFAVLDCTGGNGLHRVKVRWPLFTKRVYE